MSRNTPSHNKSTKAAERIAAELRGENFDAERERQVYHNRNYRDRLRRHELTAKLFGKGKK